MHCQICLEEEKYFPDDAIIIDLYLDRIKRYEDAHVYMRGSTTYTKSA